MKRKRGSVVSLDEPRAAMVSAGWGPSDNGEKRSAPDPMLPGIRNIPSRGWSKAHREPCPHCAKMVGKTFHGKSYPVFANHGGCPAEGAPWPLETGPHTAKEKRLLCKARASTRQAAALEKKIRALRAKRKKGKS